MSATATASPRSAISGAVTALANGIAGHLYPARGPWTTGVSEHGNTPAASITDGHRTILLTETPGSYHGDPSTLQLFADAHPTGRPEAKADAVPMEGRTIVDPRTAALHISRTLLDGIDRQMADELPMHLWEKYREEAGRTLLGALGHQANQVSIPGFRETTWRLPYGGTARARLTTIPTRVHLDLTDVPLPVAERFLAPLLPRPIAVPRPRTRKPEEWRTSGRAARRLSTLFDLDPTWTSNRTGRGDDHTVYTEQLTHGSDLNLDVTVSVPAGAPGRPTTPVSVAATCGLDTALLALSALR